MKKTLLLIGLLLLSTFAFTQQQTTIFQPDYFVKVEGGTFLMGSPLSEFGRYENEVQHSVTVSSFYIGKYEVTQKIYQTVMGKNPSYFKGDNLPVEMID